MVLAETRYEGRPKRTTAALRATKTDWGDTPRRAMDFVRLLEGHARPRYGCGFAAI